MAMKKEDKLNLVEAVKIALEGKIQEGTTDGLSPAVKKLDKLVKVIKDIDVRETMIERTPYGNLHVMTTDRKDLCTVKGDFFSEEELDDLREDGFIYDRDLEEESKEKVEEGSASNWDYFDKFEEITDKYMPSRGEGETLASQVVTAVNKLVFKWFNDGDVYDNVHYMQGWANDLSSYANWLDKYCKPASRILDSIFNCKDDETYEGILKALADKCLNAEYLASIENESTQGTIYDCDGQFVFDENYWDEDEEDEYWDEDEEDEYYD